MRYRLAFRSGHRLMGLCLVCAAVSLAGCGGGGSDLDSDSGDGDDGASTSLPYLFYQGSLKALSPDSPTGPVEVVGDGVDAVQGALDGNYQSNSETQDVYLRTVVYAHDGQLWRVSADPDESLSPAQVSAETEAQTVCDTFMGEDLADHDNSAYLYSLPGPDGKCADAEDNPWRMVTLAMGAGASPIDAAIPVMDLGDPDTGARVSWLGVEGDALKRFDPDFQNAEAITTFQQGVGYRGAVSVDKVFIQVDDKLHVYEEGDGLSGALHTFAKGLVSRRSDGKHLYFSDGNELWRLDQDQSTPSERLITDADTSAFDVYLTDDHVVYGWNEGSLAGGNSHSTLKAVAKAGGSPTTLHDGEGQLSVVTSGTYIYYNIQQQDSATAYVAKEANGTIAAEGQHADSGWVGFAEPTTLDTSTDTPAARVFLHEGYSNGSFAGATVTSFDASHYTELATMGSVPSDIGFVRFSGLGRHVLGRGPDTDGDDDIFYGDTDTDSTLTRVTETPDTDEQRVQR